MSLLRTDALNIIARRLRGEGAIGTLRRYARQARYKKAGLPIYFQIEPASVCNLRCPFCGALQTTESIASGIMEYEPYQGLIDSLVTREGYFPPIDLFYRGEPLMNPRFPEMVAYAKAQGLPVGTSTNGMLLKKKMRSAILDSGLDVMIVSFDGATKESYEALRVGAVFEKVVGRVSALIAERKALGRKKPMVDLQFIVTRKNQDEIPLIRDLVQKMGVDHLSLKSLRVPLMDRPQEEALAIGRELLPDDPTYRRYREQRSASGEVVGYELIHPSETCSWSLGAAVRYNGDLGMCCQDYSDTVDIGNVFEQDFWDVWWSDRYVRLRQAIHRRQPAICQTCD